MPQREQADVAAITGHILSLNILAKLVDKRLLTASDASNVADAVLEHLEEMQSAFPPEYRAAFEASRRGLAAFLVASPNTPGRFDKPRPPPILRDRRKR